MPWRWERRMVMTSPVLSWNELQITLNAASEMLFLEERSYTGKWDHVTVSLKKISFRTVWFMCWKHSQAEYLLKNPLICWNMLHTIMLMQRIESLKQNGLSLSKSLISFKNGLDENPWTVWFVWVFFSWVLLSSKCMNFPHYYLELCTKHPLPLPLYKRLPWLHLLLL